MDDRRNYYRVLHLQPDAPIELVRVNFRTLMVKLGAHPDLGGENWSAAHLNAAYHTLSDPVRRSEYDRELLRRYDIKILAEGRAKTRARSSPQPKKQGVNSRNYYRVLQSQRDAPLEILKASHGALRLAHPGDATLLDQALALLRDPNRRETYDRLLEVCDHVEALARMSAEFGDPAGGYESVIASYCAFCKRPHMRQEEKSPDALCLECNSPLFPPPRALLDLARRAVVRVSRTDAVTLYFDWPSSGIPGRVIDLSPTGMSCVTAASLDLDDVIKIVSEDFDAIGTVAHVRRVGKPKLTTAGMRFQTVRFPLARGNFRSIKA